MATTPAEPPSLDELCAAGLLPDPKQCDNAVRRVPTVVDPRLQNYQQMFDEMAHACMALQRRVHELDALLERERVQRDRATNLIRHLWSTDLKLLYKLDGDVLRDVVTHALGYDPS